VDAVSINGQLWKVRVHSNCGHLILERAPERRADMPSEKRQEARTARNKYHHEVTKPKRAREGKALRNDGASGGNKSSQALKWPFLIYLTAMCQAGQHAKAYDHLYAVFTQGGPSTFDPKHPARCGSRDTRVAGWVTQLMAAFSQNLAFSVIDGEGPTFGYIALFYEIGMCFGKFQAPLDQLFTNLLSSRGLRKTAHRFDNGKTHKYRTPLADDRAGEL